MPSKYFSPLVPKRTVIRKIPRNHKEQSETPIIILTLGTKPEDKEIIKGKASRIQSSRIGSAHVWVRRNAQHRGLRLPESTRFALVTVVMVAVYTSGPTNCPESTPPVSSQTYSHTKNLLQAIGPGGNTNNYES